MLGDNSATATVAVKDLGAARTFYEQTLGLALLRSAANQGLTFAAGRTELLVYRSSFAGSNQATGVTWTVPADTLEPLVRELRDRGVSFEHYDMPELTREGDIHVAGGTRAAWFKDPDGNIHSLIGAA